MIENIIDFYKRIGQYNYSEAAGVTKGNHIFFAGGTLPYQPSHIWLSGIL